MDKPKNEYYFTSEQLKEMQSKPFADKVQVSIAKILQIINITDGGIYVAFSGGKDSSVVLHLVAKLWQLTKYHDEPLTVALANTTCEYRGMLDHAKKLCEWITEETGTKINFVMTSPNKRIIDIFKEEGYPVVSKSVARKVYYIRRQMDLKQISFEQIKPYLEQTVENAEKLRELGFSDSIVSYLCGVLATNEKASPVTRLSRRWIPLLNAPFKVSSVCCEYLKKYPQKKMQKKLNLSAILGEMAEESDNRAVSYQKTGCVQDLGKGKIKGKPLGFWTEQDIYKYIYTYQIPLFKYYGEVVEQNGVYDLTGLKRTGCKLCLFRCQYKTNGIHQLKYLEPNVWKIILKPIEQGGFGYGEVINYLNTYCKCNIEL